MRVAVSLTVVTTAIALCVCAALLAQRLRRRASTHVLVGNRWVVGAQVQAPAQSTPGFRERVHRAWVLRHARAFFHGTGNEPLTTVTLERKQTSLVNLRIERDYELDFTPRRTALSSLRLQLELMALALSAFTTALLVGDDRASAPPHVDYVAGGPTHGGLGFGRLLMASIATPTPHPFVTGTSVNATPGYSVAHGNVSGGGVHSNTAQATHTNTVASHVNNFTPHSNVDARPNVGPF